jgi:hypothetical protein
LQWVDPAQHLRNSQCALPPQSPLPPDDISLAKRVERTWDELFVAVRSGRHYSAQAAHLERRIQEHADFLERDELPPEFDWHTDFRQALLLHALRLDYARYLEAHRFGIRDIWAEHGRAVRDYLHGVSIEGFKAIILIHGATALAALAVLSGQVESAAWQVKLAGKIGLVGAVLGLVVAAVGQLIVFHVSQHALGKVQGVRTETVRLSRLYAIGRWWRRFISSRIEQGNLLIYSSILIFALTAVASTIALLSG